MRSGRRRRWALRLAVAAAVSVTAGGLGLVLVQQNVHTLNDVVWMKGEMHVAVAHK